MKNNQGCSHMQTLMSPVLESGKHVKRRHLRAVLSCGLIGALALLIFPGTALSGVRENPLRVLVIQGEGVLHDTKQRVPVFLSVRVEDSTGVPAAGARVEFVAPDHGASGTFADGVHTMAVTADHTGTADVRGFRPNNLAGSFQITARAVYQGDEGSAFINQTNVSPGGSKRKWVLVAAGVLGATALVLGRGGDQGAEIGIGNGGNAGSGGGAVTGGSGSGSGSGSGTGSGGSSGGTGGGGSGSGGSGSGGGSVLPPLPPVLPISGLVRSTTSDLGSLTSPLTNLTQ